MKLTNLQISNIYNSIEILMNRVDGLGKPVETSAWFALYVNHKRLKPFMEDMMKEQYELLLKYCKMEDGKIQFDEKNPVFLSDTDKETYISYFEKLVAAERNVDIYQIRAEEIMHEKFDIETLKPLFETVIIIE